MTLTAVLFAGGESRRMGVDKATASFAGQPLWARQLALLRELSPDRILVSARTKPAWCPAEIRAILDEPPSRGPLSGLAAALKDLQTTHLLALGIDLPVMTVEHLRKLWTQAVAGVGVIPQNKDYLEPLCAIYPIGAAATAAAMLPGINVSLQPLARTLLEQRQAVLYAVSQDEQPLYHNVNTPADLQ